MANFLIPAIIIPLLITIILSVIFKDKSKVDKGFRINYYGLSYRRKMIRTLIISPLLILTFIFIYLNGDMSMLAKISLGLFFLIASAGQLIYNFYMWKKNES
ncbi:ATPase [Gracilibacillus oryzae]|uniref:ATPase n=1 Tax=Gracilibacillus oryzae TaxID=1672701 RepID=A0A7C8KXA9_9BACI|nr:ATPase [Gracilibacillus oryzae]KAB8127378.1 ATPase [Gracilibacillus oryzae]